MARRSDHSKDALKELALSIGEQCVREQGLAGITARGVTKQMGYTVGTLYHVFGSLDEFILQVNARTLDRWYAQLREAVQDRAAPASIHALAQTYIYFAVHERMAWLSLFEHRLPETLPLPAWYQEKMDRFFGMLEAEVMRCQVADVALTARLLWAGIHGIAMLAVHDKLDITHNQSAQQLAEAMVARLLSLHQ